MATHTTNYNLKKPDGSDPVLISDINGNMDIIDQTMKTTNDQIGTLNSNLAKHIQRRTATGTVTAGANSLADVDFVLNNAFSNSANTYVLINAGSSSLLPICLRSWADGTHLNARIMNYGAALSSVTYTMFVIGFPAQT